MQFLIRFINIIINHQNNIMHSSMNIDRKAGPNRWIAHLFLIPFFQCVFYGSIGICFYTIFTLNYQLAAFLALISVLQRFAKKSEFVVNLINKYIQPLNYFKTFKRIYQEQIPDQTPPLFCIHPHSVLSYCIPANMNADNSKMSQMTGLASRFILAMPFIGLQLRLWGIQSVNPKNIRRLLHNKKPVGLVPGGFQQATLTTPNQLRIFIKHRKGFIKYALQHGYTIYPVLCYNEHKAFKTLDKFTNFRLKLNKFKIPAVLFGGGFLGIFLPLDLHIVNIVGRGIRRSLQNVGKDITHEEINDVHAEYIKELQRMHGKYREQYGEAQMVFY